MKKLYKNNFTILISSLALSSSLIACAPNKTNKEQIKNDIVTKTLIQTVNEADDIINKGKNISKEMKNRNKDKEIKEYINEFKQEIFDLKNTAKEKWNSKETQEKISMIRQKLKNLFDFIFNGKEINGITFANLSEEGKQITLNGFYELDGYIELLIPNYKERFHDWTIDKGADALERYDSLKEWFDGYREETQEEYDSRKTKSK